MIYFNTKISVYAIISLSLSWAKINCITELNMKFYSKFYARLKQKQNYFYYSFDIHLIHSHDVFTFTYSHWDSHYVSLDSVDLTWILHLNQAKLNTLTEFNIHFNWIHIQSICDSYFLNDSLWTSTTIIPHTTPYHHLTSYIISQYHHANWWLNVDQIQNINNWKHEQNSCLLFM